MTDPAIVPYGAWASPIGADALTRGDVRFSHTAIDGDHVYWLERRPAESGRTALVRCRPDGDPEDVLPATANVRTMVHEYGGGAYAVAGGALVYSDFSDGRLRRADVAEGPAGDAGVPITPEPETSLGLRYADLAIRPGGAMLACVRERHAAHDEHAVINELVVVRMDGSDEPVVVASGRDFYAAPRWSPDGSRLAYLAWDQPRMPWDGTELFVADVDPDGRHSVTRPVAGGPTESVFQPAWGPDGALHFVSDRTGWWNLYRDRGGEGGGDVGAIALCPRDEEFGVPAWLFGMATYGFLEDGRIACRHESRGEQRVGILDPATGELLDLDLTFSVFEEWISAGGAQVVLVVGGPTRPSAVLSLDLRAADVTVLREADGPGVPTSYLSTPEPIEFPTEGGRTAFAYHYPPTNPDVRAPDGERPPLLVLSHGGPTSATEPRLTLDIQYFTSRGFAVVDVNYGGSTGFGRAYRERLNGAWGIVDVQDCAAAARSLVERGAADGSRLLATGGSAGGWTTLCLLTFRDEFAAGASYYGVADLTPFVEITHKFEARYLDSLVGPWPEARALYDERSPLRHTDLLSKPMLVLQGLDDMVVPPAQSEALVAALASKGIPHAYVAFPGEGHGFRRSENIVRALESELSFYAQVLGFTPAGDIPELEIVGLPAR